MLSKLALNANAMYTCFEMCKKQAGQGSNSQLCSRLDMNAPNGPTASSMSIPDNARGASCAQPPPPVVVTPLHSSSRRETDTHVWLRSTPRHASQSPRDGENHRPCLTISTQYVTGTSQCRAEHGTAAHAGPESKAASSFCGSAATCSRCEQLLSRTGDLRR